MTVMLLADFVSQKRNDKCYSNRFVKNVRKHGTDPPAKTFCNQTKNVKSVRTKSDVGGKQNEYIF